MSASRTKKARQAEVVMGMSPKQRKEAEEARRHRRHAILYTIIGVIIVLVVAFLLIWDNGIIQKHVPAVTVGDKSYGVVDLDYYYNVTYSNYYSYASYYGLDTSESLSKQELYSGYTWDDMLKDSAVSMMNYVSMLAAEAEKAGYELSADGQATVTNALNTASLYASVYGYTENYYLQANFGKYMTAKAYERILSEYQLAVEYEEYKENSFEVSEEEISDYYEANSAALDTLDYAAFYFGFSRTETDDDGNTVDLDEDTIEAARAEAEETAQAVVDALTAGDTETAEELVDDYGASNYSNYSSVSYYDFGEWLNDTDHQAGDSTVIESTNSSDEVTGYYAVYINERYLDEYCPADARILTIYADTDDDDNYDMDSCLAQAEDILAEFADTDQTSEDFTTLYNTYDGTTADGGMTEGITKNVYGDAVDDWLFSEDRVQGDCQMFEDDDNGCCYFFFFENLEDTPYWRSTTVNTIKSTKLSDWEDETIENYELTTRFGFRFVGEG